MSAEQDNIENTEASMKPDQQVKGLKVDFDYLTKTTYPDQDNFEGSRQDR